METFYKDKLEEERSALKQKEEELNSFKYRMTAELAVSMMEGESKSMNIPLSKTPAEMERIYKEKLNEARSALKQREEELKSVRHSLSEMEMYKKKLHEARSALKQKEDQLKSVKYRPKNQGIKSSCQRCETHELEHKESLSQMETFYKEKVQEARSALKQKEDELKSFKERYCTCKQPELQRPICFIYSPVKVFHSHTGCFFV
ncbi:inner centromere protein-like [Seriola lalandi dorsalis]|uniref:inner centromere protein-like n=1 Tax=Seriola lalandi dorsalis TaxID=1841481 RepID=UPI000C6FC367|nr:inner centromere protein-like [Seriola lalandi dorsalis]